MRILVSLVLVLPLLAGCFGGDEESSPATSLPGLTVADVVRPSPGEWRLEETAAGVVAILTDAALPATVDLVVPEGATMVRAVADSGASGVSMAHAETGRRRCNNPSVESFSDGFGFPKSCSGLTAIDGPATTWRATFGGTGSGDLRIEFLDTPVDGLASHLALDLVTPVSFPLKPVEVQFIESFDGVLLRVELHLPEGDGPWPVILESSPYHDDGVRAQPASFAYFANDWARRGYAVVVADVRGFGDSGGCVEVWGPNEQADQKFLVEWAAAQPWSDGNVGFYGQSYVGTTPVEAAVQAPPALKAIIAVAPVIHSYDDWHFGGVPNGESRLSPVAYQVLTEGTVTGAPNAIGEGNVRTDPIQLLNNLGNGLCDPTLVARANDPRALDGTQFYNERNFKARAGDVTAAVLYTQGFEDANVKGAMIPGWFNELTAPKLGLFGHFLHQHPPRMDTEALMIGWFEQYLKGKAIGFEGLPAADILVDRETHRTASEWPPSTPTNTTLWPDFGTGTLRAEPGEGEGTIFLDPAGALPAQVTGPTTLEFTTTLSQDVSLAGSASLHVVGDLDGAANAYLGAELWVGDSLVTWGRVNLAHNADHTAYDPLTPGEVRAVDLPMRPTEWVLKAGDVVRVVLSGAGVADTTDPGGAVGAMFTFHGGEEGTALVLPGVPLSEYQPIPLSARP